MGSGHPGRVERPAQAQRSQPLALWFGPNHRRAGHGGRCQGRPGAKSRTGRDRRGIVGGIRLSGAQGLAALHGGQRHGGRRPLATAPRVAVPAQLFPDLTDREREVLEWVAQDCNNAQIAEGLVISPKTIRNHVSNVFSKLQVTDRAQAIIRAREAGLGRQRT